MSNQYQVIIERDVEGYYVASVPSLPGCHTQARSLDQLDERIKEAIALYLEVEGEAEERLDFVGLQQVTVSRSASGRL
jgi:predicted RNase H-like HicB family nuclease